MIEIVIQALKQMAKKYGDLYNAGKATVAEADAAAMLEELAETIESMSGEVAIGGLAVGVSRVAAGISQTGPDKSCYAEYRDSLQSGFVFTDGDLEEAWNWSQQHGPPNCWAGTTGRGAMLLRWLLREITWQRKQAANHAEDDYVEREAKAMHERGEEIK